MSAPCVDQEIQSCRTHTSARVHTWLVESPAGPVYTTTITSCGGSHKLLRPGDRVGSRAALRTPVPIRDPGCIERCVVCSVCGGFRRPLCSLGGRPNIRGPLFQLPLHSANLTRDPGCSRGSVALFRMVLPIHVCRCLSSPEPSSVASGCLGYVP